MGMAQLVVTAVLVEGRSTAEVARDYKVSHLPSPCGCREPRHGL